MQYCVEYCMALEKGLAPPETEESYVRTVIPTENSITIDNSLIKIRPDIGDP